MFADILLALILLSVWAGLYQIVNQQGRILLRLDQLEAQRSSALDSAQPSGLQVGGVFPSFSLPDLYGKTVRLEDFRGKQLLLVHWSAGCGFCESIASELAALERNLPKHNAQMLLLANDDAESNRELAREHGLASPILLMEGKQTPEPFRYAGTPVAYLLDSEGRVAQPFAEGADEVPALARSLVPDTRRLPGDKPLSESRIRRDGLKAGSPAPGFRLKNIHGGTVSLDDYRGRRVLLVFSDPHCGPCDALGPDLAQLHQMHKDNGLAFVMIGRGDVQENRRKARQFGIEFPVALQDKWKLSKEYGIFSTPVAFLIGDDGVILKDVAVGVDAITALAHEALAKEKDLEHALSS